MISMSRWPTTNARASRIGLPPFGRRSVGNISSRRIATSEKMIAKKVTPLRMKHQAVPIVATSTPASAGPKMREPVITAVFNDVALGMSDGRDQFGHQSAPRRIVERVDHTEEQRQRVDHRQVRPPSEVDRAEHAALAPPTRSA